MKIWLITILSIHTALFCAVINADENKKIDIDFTPKKMQACIEGSSTLQSKSGKDHYAGDDFLLAYHNLDMAPVNIKDIEKEKADKIEMLNEAVILSQNKLDKAKNDKESIKRSIEKTKTKLAKLVDYSRPSTGDINRNEKIELARKTLSSLGNKLQNIEKEIINIEDEFDQASSSYNEELKTYDYEVEIKNDLPIPIKIMRLVSGKSDVDNSFAAIKVEANKECRNCPIPPGKYLVTENIMGGLISVFEVNKLETKVIISNMKLRRPNSLGLPPESSFISPIQNTRKVLMSASVIDHDPAGLFNDGEITKDENGIYLLLAYQDWEQSIESHSLAPLESKTIQFTETAGREETTSESQSLDKSISTSVSGGWGPVSASVSASINQNSTHEHSVTLDSRKTSYQEKYFENPYIDASIIIFFWQLGDSYVLIKQSDGDGDGDGKVFSASGITWKLTTTQSPSISQHAILCGTQL